MRRVCDLLTAGPALAVVVLLAGFIVPTDAAAQARHSPRGAVQHNDPGPYQGRGQLVFEAGAAVPLGDLGDDFETTDKGLDAKTGYELGLRYRYFVVGGLAVSPAFHYTNFGDDQGVYDDDGQERGFEVATSVYRYGVDFQQFIGPPDAPLRGYLSAGVALYHNRYRDFAEGLGTFETSTNSLGFSAGAGLVLGPVELSGWYDFDRTSNDDLPSAGSDHDFNWDHVTARVGFVIARY
jgi:hypothetical protein